MNRISLPGLCRLTATVLFLMAVVACSALRPNIAPPPAFYALDLAGPTAPRSANASGPTLLVLPTRAAAGFDSPRILYLRQDHQIEYFAHSEWVDTPARMLGAPLLAQLQAGGGFGAVVASAGAAAGDLRLDTEIVRLQQEFQHRPSQVRFTLRATLIDERTRRVLAWREFDRVQAAASDDPAGGVDAANRAVRSALQSLAQFCLDTATTSWPAARP